MLIKKKYGYTEKRADIIYDVIDKNAKKFIADNYRKPVRVNDKSVKLKNYLTDVTTEKKKKKIRTMVEDYYEAMAAGRSEEEAEIQVKDYFGFERINLYQMLRVN